MPTIRIDYDNAKLSDGEIRALSNAVRDIVAQITGIEDTFVYAESPRIKVKAAPIEVFVQMSASAIPSVDDLLAQIKTKLSEWKKETAFAQPINLTLMPMDWKFEIDI